MTQLEVHRPGRLAGHVDHEQAVDVGLALRPLDEACDAFGVAWAHGREVRLHLLVGEQLDQEIDVVFARATDRDAHPGTVTAARRRSRRTPEASATPSRIRARPASTDNETGSSSNRAP